MRMPKLLQNRVTVNAVWLIAGKMAHMLLSFLIGLLTARYLGPDNFGLINYAGAYGTFFAALCTLGINSIIVKNFIDHPEEEGKTIGTTLILRGVSSLLSALLIVGIVAIIDRGEPLTLAVVALYSIGLIFQIFDTLNYWFQARLQSKYYAMATLGSFILVSIYKVLLLILGKSVRWFAISNAIDYAIVGLVVFWIYKKKGGPRFSFSTAKARELLGQSHSFIVTGLMVAVYASTDRLMLKQMMDGASVAYYSLAVSFSSSWGFLLSAVIDSMTPDIMRKHQRNQEEYTRSNRRMYALVFYIAVIVSAIVSLFAPWLIHFLYGAEYAPTVAPLRIVVWYTAFSYLGVARNAWIVCEGRQKYLQVLYLCAAITNVGLNLLLIPNWGAAGAAMASLITQIATILIIPVFVPSLRENAKLMINSIFLRGVF